MPIAAEVSRIRPRVDASLLPQPKGAVGALVQGFLHLARGNAPDDVLSQARSTIKRFTTEVDEEVKNSQEEGLCYMDENGFFVMTRKALLEQGKCCGNGCKHCPYQGRQEEDDGAEQVLEPFNPDEWRRIEITPPPFNVVPFIDGSYLTKLSGKENEWVMTQDGAPLPGEGTYNIGDPLAMRAWHAPEAGEEARRIMEKGRRPDDPLATDKEATLKEAQESYFFFPQIYGRRGLKYGPDTGTVACMSTGLPWDRQTPIEDSAREILRGIAGDPNAPIVWFGPHKAITVVRGPQTPREMVERLVETPLAAYENNMSHLANAVRQIRDIRRRTILGVGGKADDFEADFDDISESVDRAFGEDGAEGFEWMYKKMNGLLTAVNPDGKLQTMLSLAEKGYAQDFDMKNKIMSVLANIDEADWENIYIVEINFDDSATCCGFSSNAQRTDPRDSFDPSEMGKLAQYENNIVDARGTRLLQQAKGHTCDTCGERFMEEHTCKKAIEELAQAAE